MLFFVVLVNWNNSFITNVGHLTLIYHDEIKVDVGPNFRNNWGNRMPGDLYCTSGNTPRGSWHYPNGTLVDLVTAEGRVIQQIRTSVTPYWSQLSRYNPDAQLTTAKYNGLWTCRLNGNANGAVSVGIYHRGGSKD